MNSDTVNLSSERWARVEALFDTAVDMPANERNAYLAEACADDIELRGYISSLLDTDIGQDELVSDMISGALQSIVPDEFDNSIDASGDRIGTYKILRQIGSGGMGIVYLAERADEQFEIQVAIKLVRQRLVDPNVKDRLRAERQILANLDHPNIARLLDGGTTDDGTPYLVMEYIRGVPIDTFCDQQRLDVDQRLELFRNICTAVHYAHQNLVVHRDIKASNILVTEDGTVKLLDFGIAKLIDTSGMATDQFTREGAILLTPENAAPEQILSKPVTTATDTYALGMLLHRLLLGFAPLPLAGRTLREIAQIICQQPVERPSKLLEDGPALERIIKGDTAAIELQQICVNRRTTSDRLRRRLKGDLDNILLTALRKEPDRRYRSVNEFSEDIRLHRGSMPVLARADTWGYRTGKFVRRHTAAVTSSILAVILLASFGVVTLMQNQRIAEERDTAREISTFLEEIFMEPDPARARGLETTAKDILANGANRIQQQLEGRPEIQSALMETIGRVYLNLGEYDQSVSMLEQSLSLRIDSFGSQHAEVAESQNDLAVTLTRQGEFDRAEQLLQSALKINARESGPESAEVASNLFNLAELQLKIGALDLAEDFARTSIELYANFSETLPLKYAEAISVLAVILQAKGDLQETEILLRNAIEIVRTNVDSNHPMMAYLLQNLAVLLKSKGDIDEAEAMFHESIDVTRRILGDKHDLLGSSLVMLGGLLHEKGEYEAAETTLRDALRIHREARGATHPFVGYDMTSLGMLLHDKGELGAAEDTLREALDVYAESLDENHQYIGSSLTELGAVLNTGGSAAAAEPILLRAINIRLRDYPPENLLVAGTYSVYGDTLTRLGRFNEAEKVLLQNFEHLRLRNDRRSRNAVQAIIRLYEAWGKPAMAIRYQKMMTALGTNSSDPDN